MKQSGLKQLFLHFSLHRFPAHMAVFIIITLLTSGGISAGIDMSLYVIELIYGRDTAQRTAAYMEYRRI